MEGNDEGHSHVVSDLFLGLAAIIILVLAVASSTQIGWMRNATTADQVNDFLAEQGQSEEQTLVLDHRGMHLLLVDGAALTVPVDEILSLDVEGTMRSKLLIVILDGGSEASFLLDVVLAKAEFSEVRRVRISGRCENPKIDALQVTCLRYGQ